MPEIWTDPITSTEEDSVRLAAVRKVIKAYDDGLYTSLMHFAVALNAAAYGPDEPQEE